ncbi:hypothetical protein [Streptomyces sp. NPDC057253]|uniref:hypothetical protein n=1 Tax=Streptomyces sp. NPDC057253 TaxID=3346069 RepID=UPI00362BA502
MPPLPGDLRASVNSDEGQRLGLPRLPDDAITPRVLRRTLLVELAHRHGGAQALSRPRPTRKKSSVICP